MLLLYTVLVGLSGLMVEWLLIGNSPWGNPDASQMGLFAYWACMALVPFMFWIEKRAVQAFIIRYALIYALLVLPGQLLVASPDW